MVYKDGKRLRNFNQIKYFIKLFENCKKHVDRSSFVVLQTQFSVCDQSDAASNLEYDSFI